MGLLGWVEIIKAVLMFPDAILRIVRVFQKTPQEMHEQIVMSIEKEAKQFEETGRPTWT